MSGKNAKFSSFVVSAGHGSLYELSGVPNLGDFRKRTYCFLARKINLLKKPSFLYMAYRYQIVNTFEYILLIL
ncbi:Uncharacterized protein dnm_059430 [Desulfonema magnum]|uniref:Uncharacterized protein n=1 Tax=Desulfonema magnum TaxID=45655 RepID=A0A975BQL4_9BACT|nr:Uncharacterized protein dnm_059430 [Desulfonema magnum]